MNLTVLSLCSSLFYGVSSKGLAPMSPFFSITQPIFFNLDKSIFSHFFSPIISFSGYTPEILTRSAFSFSISEDKFSYFLKRALEFSTTNVELTGEQITRYVAQSGTSNITIRKCQFINMPTSTGGSAIYIQLAADAQIQSTNFDNMQSTGSGGAIFYDSGSSNILYSNYNCFSNCHADLGSAIYGKGSRIEIYFSGTTICNGNGAQIDIYSPNYIMSSHLNLTGGTSKYTGAMECRSAPNGFFNFQTLVGFTSYWVIALSDTGEGLEVSNSNIVDCKLDNTYSDTDNRPAIYFQQGGKSVMQNFCVFRCQVNTAKSKDGKDGKLSSVRLLNGNERYGQTNIVNLITDLSETDVNYNTNNIIVTNPIYDVINPTTHDIKQLNLGECAGEEIAPDLIEPTVTETPDPTVTETPKPTVTETPKPTVTETPKPTVTETPKPTVTETPKPTVTEISKPTETEISKATMTETEVPFSTLYVTESLKRTHSKTVTLIATKSPSILCSLTQAPNSIFSNTAIFTESQFFISGSGEKDKSKKKRNKNYIYFIISISLSAVIVTVFSILSIYERRKRLRIANYNNEEEEEIKETNDDMMETNNDINQSSDPFVIND